MKIIIPMAGRGTRLRPHTLTVPKPLIPVAGKPIIQRLVESLSAAYPGQVDEIAFVVGDFGEQIEQELLAIAGSFGAQGRIYRQEEALGVGHAIYCAAASLEGPCLIAFADTLFKADFTFDLREDGVIWVQRVDNPSSFGVVQLDTTGYITDFVEKPTVFVSDLAIVGIYYFREAEKLRDALRHLLDHDIRDKNEYQLTSALDRLKNEGLRFATGEIEEWLDCGNKDAILHANSRMLEFQQKNGLVAATATIENSVVIPPCFVGENAVIRNAIVGPFTSVGHNSLVENAVVARSLIQNHAEIRNAVLEHSMIGNASRFVGSKDELNLGDYSHFYSAVKA